MKIRKDLYQHFLINFIPCFFIILINNSEHQISILCLFVFVFWTIGKEVVYDWFLKRGQSDLLDVWANFIGCISGIIFGSIFKFIYITLYGAQ